MYYRLYQYQVLYTVRKIRLLTIQPSRSQKLLQPTWQEIHGQTRTGFFSISSPQRGSFVCIRRSWTLHTKGVAPAEFGLLEWPVEHGKVSFGTPDPISNGASRRPLSECWVGGAGQESNTGPDLSSGWEILVWRRLIGSYSGLCRCILVIDIYKNDRTT